MKVLINHQILERNIKLGTILRLRERKLVLLSKISSLHYHIKQQIRRQVESGREQWQSFFWKRPNSKERLEVIKIPPRNLNISLKYLWRMSRRKLIRVQTWSHFCRQCLKLSIFLEPLNIIRKEIPCLCLAQILHPFVQS